jgi:Arc/MetJ-type ribon-helix-helix transcriptional regulator
MPYHFPADLERRIRAQIQNGALETEDAVLREAMDTLERRQKGLARLQVDGHHPYQHARQLACSVVGRGRGGGASRRWWLETVDHGVGETGATRTGFGESAGRVSTASGCSCVPSELQEARYSSFLSFIHIPVPNSGKSMPIRPGSFCGSFSIDTFALGQRAIVRILVQTSSRTQGLRYSRRKRVMASAWSTCWVCGSICSRCPSVR